jgi:UDPglucose--hexose-1-phosphate uridylyltransferase
VPEFRQDPTSGEWVILAAERAKRPGGARRSGARRGSGKADPGCPFCPGNEHETPPEILRRPASADWVVRVVPNKYPALVPGLSDPTPVAEELRRRAPARGHYEVVVEGPHHRTDLAPDDDAVLLEVFLAVRERYRFFLGDPDLQLFSLFKNHGMRAGASLPHPHWQLVASPLLSPSLRQLLNVAADYFGRHGRSVYGDVVDWEIETGERLVAVTDQFAAITPYAPQWAGETWVVPREPAVSFGESDDDKLAAFAAVLRETFHRVAVAFDDPSVNVLVHSAPLRDLKAPGFRWHVRIQPRLTTPGGFELATGMAIVTVAPEGAAERMKAVRR